MYPYITALYGTLNILWRFDEMYFYSLNLTSIMANVGSQVETSFNIDAVPCHQVCKLVVERIDNYHVGLPRTSSLPPSILYRPFFLSLCLNFLCHISQPSSFVLFVPMLSSITAVLPFYCSFFSSSWCSLDPHFPTPTSEYCFPLHNHGCHLPLPLSSLIPLFLMTNNT